METKGTKTKMTDSDIPIAYGTLVDTPSHQQQSFVPMAPPGDSSASASMTPSSHRHDLRTATAMNGGRSSRVLLPRNGQENAAMSESTIQSLLEQGYTRGLAEALRKNKHAFPLSIWIVDNSGSMASPDGHRLVATTQSQKVKLVPCTRWAEMQQTVDYHVQMAALLTSPTVFRLLNDPGRHVGPQQFSVAERGSQHMDEDLAIAQSCMMNATPSGVTPLIAHLHEIRQNVIDMESSLRKDGTRVVVVLATDGLPTNESGISSDVVKQQFVQALRALEGLPVWLVIRLCTDDDTVVQYYNTLDDQLELSTYQKVKNVMRVMFPWCV
jgi:Mg-chelatase subunit ChlD